MVETVAAEHEIEPEIEALLADLERRLERRFGERFVALYLFGSRARGDHEPDSDVDVAVVLDQEMPRPFDVTREILEDTYDLLLDTGYYIQPWPLEKGSLDDPLSHPYPQISRAVLRDGTRYGPPLRPHQPRRVARREAYRMTEDLLRRARRAVRSAKTLLSTGDLNGAVNRAYYAMFHAAQAALAHRGVEAASSKHGNVVGRFGQHLVKTRLLPRSLGTSLNQMLELRQKADYGGSGVTPVDAERGLSQAEAFVVAVERLVRG
ncbi:MAG: HEPN domain-containing protein [Geminicoccaceae bacterium]